MYIGITHDAAWLQQLIQFFNVYLFIYKLCQKNCNTHRKGTTTRCRLSNINI